METLFSVVAQKDIQTSQGDSSQEFEFFAGPGPLLHVI